MEAQRIEIANPGARLQPAGCADEGGTLQHDDPRLQAPRHDIVYDFERAARAPDRLAYGNRRGH